MDILAARDTDFQLTKGGNQWVNNLLAQESILLRKEKHVALTGQKGEEGCVCLRRAHYLLCKRHSKLLKVSNPSIAFHSLVVEINLFKFYFLIWFLL